MKDGALDPEAKALIVDGDDDLSCPPDTSRVIAAQIAVMRDPGLLQVTGFPGGPLFCSRPSRQAALKRDVEAFYAGD